MYDDVEDGSMDRERERIEQMLEDGLISASEAGFMLGALNARKA